MELYKINLIYFYVNKSGNLTLGRKFHYAKSLILIYFWWPQETRFRFNFFGKQFSDLSIIFCKTFSI